jgi:predicted HicB family RNase H-like nuclease
MKKKTVKDIAINTRYPPEIHEAIIEIAKKHQRSFNGEVIWALREHIARQQGDKEDQQKGQN